MAIKGSCHCQATKFELVEAPATVTACTCSFCSKRGALWAYYLPDDVTFTSTDHRGTYQWGSRTIKHHFCAVCGCGTYTELQTGALASPTSTIPKSASMRVSSTTLISARWRSS